MNLSSRAIFIACFSFLLLFGCLDSGENVQINESNKTINQSNENQSNLGTANSTINKIENSSIKNESYDFSPVFTNDGKLIIYFFHAPHCPACKSIQSKVEDIGFRYQNWTEWKGFNINIDSDRDVYFQFYNEFNLTPERSGTPMILVNNSILWGQCEINDSLGTIINESIKQG